MTDALNARTSLRVLLSPEIRVQNARTSARVLVGPEIKVRNARSSLRVLHIPGPEPETEPEPPDLTHHSEFTFTTTYRPVCEVLMDDDTWLDASCYTHEAEILRGRERFTDRFEPGTATVTFDNRTGWADMIGTPDEIYATPLRPARQIRIGIEGPWDLPVSNTADFVLWLYYGYIDTSRPSYDPVQEDIVTITAIDALGEVGRVKLPTLIAIDGTGETANNRVNRTLTMASWAGGRTLAPSAVTLLGTTFGSQVIDELGRAADSAGGVVYGDMNGGIAYKDRDWMLWATGTPVDATIGFSTETDDDVCPTAWETSFDRAELTTQVEIGRQTTPTEIPTIYTDTTAKTRYGAETFTRTDLQCSNAATMFPILANRWIAIRGATSMPRIEAVALNASNAADSPFITWQELIDENATWTAVMSTYTIWDDIPVGTPAEPIRTMATCMPEEPSRYRCRLTTHSGRTVFDRLMFATSVSHLITRNEWSSRIGLDAAEWAET